MMYRFVIAFLVLIFFASSTLQSSFNRNVILSISISVTFLIIWSIGSRGGIILLLFVVFFPCIFNRSSRFIVGSVLLLAASILFIQNYDALRSILGRLILFDLANSSEMHRYSQYVLYLSWIRNVGITEFLFGSGVGSYPYNVIYPHSWILEAHVYYGLFFLFLLIWLHILSWLVCVKLGPNYQRLWFLFSIPPYLSGSFFDNHYSLAFWLVLSSYALNRRLFR